MGATKSFLRGVTLGAGLMYLLDSKRGQVRRRQLGQKVNDLFATARHRFDAGDFELGGMEIGHYGARVGDIAGLGAATLGLLRPEGAGAANLATLRIVGGMLALYGLTRRGTL